MGAAFTVASDVINCTLRIRETILRDDVPFLGGSCFAVHRSQLRNVEGRTSAKVGCVFRYRHATDSPGNEPFGPHRLGVRCPGAEDGLTSLEWEDRVLAQRVRGP